MDEETFDTLSKRVSAATVGRRGIVARLAGGLLGIALGQGALADTAAKQKRRKRRKHGRKTPGSPDCTPNCTGKNCGGDGCGGSCGSCGNGLTCANTANGGVCQCASGVCGGVCCTNSQTCVAGSCCAKSKACNGTCCATNTTCSAGQCCPNARICGNLCCGANQTCVAGACRSESGLDDQERALLTSINDHRAANGRNPLTLQSQLTAAAELHSQDQATHDFSGHTGSDGSTPPQRITRAGYDWSAWGENVYWNSNDGSARAAFDWWRNSPGHNANMLSASFTEIGIGRAQSSRTGRWYWTTTFGRR